MNPDPVLFPLHTYKMTLKSVQWQCQKWDEQIVFIGILGQSIIQ